MQTLLNATNANVWHNIAPERSFLDKANGIANAERKIWGRKASRSSCVVVCETGEEFMCKRVLYSEKLCR